MKKNTLKRIAAAAAAVVLCLGTAAMPVMGAQTERISLYAEEAEQKAMKAALTAVKKRYSVPERLTEFNYRSDTQLGAERFNFTWNDKENKESITIAYVNNLITQYSYTKRSDDEKTEVKQSFAKLSDSELIAKAKSHFKTLNPDIADKVKYSVSHIELFGNNATVNMDRVENGIPVDGNGGTVVIDKNTGSLVQMNIEWFWNGTKFADKKNRISVDDVRESYKELTTLTPIYRIVDEYDEKTQEYKQKAVFLFTSDFSSEIDAFTGEKSTIWDDMRADKGSSRYGYYYFNNYAATTEDSADFDDCDEAAGDSDGGVVFTEAELKEIETDKGLLKKSDITALLQKNKYTNMPSYAKLISSNLYKNEYTDEYIYNVSYRGGDYSYDEPIIDEVADGSPAANVKTEPQPYFYLYATINAKTGEILSYRKQDNSQEYDDSKPYPVKANGKIAREAAKFFYKDIFGEYRYNESNDTDDTFYTDSKTGEKKYTQTSRSYIFNRYVNDTIVENDTISIMVDKNGNVEDINSNYTDVKFPKAYTLDKDKAFEQLFKQIKISLYYDGYYKPDGTVRTYLLYDIPSYTLNGNYRLVSWDGSAYEPPAENDTDYTDIKGIAQEKAITTLARYGIVLPSEGGKFDPKAKLTDKEFAQVVYAAIRNYVPYYISNGNYKNEEKAITLTKKEAAKVFVDCYGGSGYAELKGIYRAPFKDVASSDEYVGYIAIAKALGFAAADKDGNYSPNKTLTRAQAMQMIYDYILRLK